MEIDYFDIIGPALLKPRYFTDARGYFVESYNKKTLLDAVGLDCDFVQDNESFSGSLTMRGLHFQNPPFEQGKLVRVLSGRILDVALDIRKGSDSYGQHISVELSDACGRQLWIPPGFAHGFLTLEANTKIFYKTTNFYSVEHDAGIKWNDPALAINWPVTENLVISEKDQNLPRLAELES